VTTVSSTPGCMYLGHLLNVYEGAASYSNVIRIEVSEAFEECKVDKQLPKKGHTCF